ncbi:MAG: DEAD/DEAH box helicase [Methylobacter sp.]|uniref:DEAD/DEAH box helicase n=1 Tax=Methylobacter sp. TaxID=2051955 RepID=UPI002585C2A9|nr:DEAD/DEAH box helicase [Methylobacter sp.]MCL7421897.1 DEAD/DEAH box helicase [Methylobacter sp.]
MLPDGEGLNLFIEYEQFKACSEGTADLLLLNQYACLQMLVEEGLADTIRNGFVIPSEHAVCLDADVRYLLKLPPLFEGRVSARVEGQTSQAAFNVRLILHYLGEDIYNYELTGPCLKISEKEIFLLNQQQWLAFNGVKKHQQLSASDKNEQQNLLLIHQLQQVKKAGFDIDLAQFNKLHIICPEKVGVAAEQAENGDLILTPTFGSGINPHDTAMRLGQLKEANNAASLHIRDDIVLLDEERFKATQEILTNRRIPKDQVRRFLAMPTAFLDAALVDLDTGFSLRVKGATAFHHGYFGDTDESGIDWFGPMAEKTLHKPLADYLHDVEEITEFEKKFADAKAHGADSMLFNGENIDISKPEEIEEQIDQLKRKYYQAGNKQEDYPETEPEAPLEKAVVDIATNDDVLEFGDKSLLHQAEQSWFSEQIDFDSYRRQPFPHQEEGIRWLLGLMRCASKSTGPNIEGALLADDMGLGKTYMSLVALSEFYKLTDLHGEIKRPSLIVAPLSLVENWIDETDKTFLKSPFKDIVVLQSGRDLKKFKIQGASTETKQVLSDDSSLDSESIRYSLKIGKFYGNDRLDLPQRLVVTTYQTLRDYQFSLCRIDWQMVIFDEAQNIKNPNALQTRAAKGLKACFKLLATGTPVENSLADFWCLLDTAQPGLLGSYQEFRTQFIKPITQADANQITDVRIGVGKKLRQDVGQFMLRRLKEDSLKGLPRKTVFVGAENNNQAGWIYEPALSSVMQNSQLAAYDNVISNIQSIRNSGGDARGIILQALQELRAISLHPALVQTTEYLNGNLSPKPFTSLSDKLMCVLRVLNDIQKRKEKVIIFIVNKNLQRLLKLCLSQLYDVPVNVINGDTKAVVSTKGAETRKQLIEQFERQPGFGIIIMSPIAAGVGLTVVGANNVIHLERHWNPAKEAQATDRVYRIGQQKNVNIYIPILLHPQHVSFDLNLNSLLQNKIDLKDAVMTPQVVNADEMLGVFEQ